MDSDATSSKEGKLTKKSSSFRLRSSSLNSVRLRRVFDLFDKNGDGVITADEIGKALVLLGLEADPSETALESITNSFVKPGNPGLTFEDFESLHKSLDEALLDGPGDDPDAETSYNSDIRDNGQEIQEDPISQEESDLTEAFKVFDVDGDGYISAKELQVVLEKLGLPEAGEMDRVERMISSVDRNADGLVDFFEFKDMMRSVMVRSS